MIELKFTGMCEGCKIADLELREVRTMNGQSLCTVHCKHYPACTKWARPCEGVPRGTNNEQQKTR